MRATRAYALYNRASGGKKLTTIARAPLSSARPLAGQERRIELVKRDAIPWQDDDRPPARPAAGARPRARRPHARGGPARRDRRADAPPAAPRARSELKRGVLDTYGLVRLTQRADEYLDARGRTALTVASSGSGSKSGSSSARRPKCSADRDQRVARRRPASTSGTCRAARPVATSASRRSRTTSRSRSIRSRTGDRRAAPGAAGSGARSPGPARTMSIRRRPRAEELVGREVGVERRAASSWAERLCSWRSSSA